MNFIKYDEHKDCVKTLVGDSIGEAPPETNMCHCLRINTCSVRSIITSNYCNPSCDMIVWHVEPIKDADLHVRVLQTGR